MDDASPEFDLRQLVGPPFRVERNARNLGFCANINAGARLATGEFLFLLNSDIEVQSVWLDPAVQLMQTHPQIGVVGIKLVFPKDEHGDENIQSCGGWYDANHMPFHRYLGWRATDPRVNHTEKVSWTTGAALLTRQSIFNELGGLDEAYGQGYFDDPDYCERVKQQGYEIWYCAEAVATHQVGLSMMGVQKTEAEAHQAQLRFYRNARRFESRWRDRIVPDVQYVAVNY